MTLKLSKTNRDTETKRIFVPKTELKVDHDSIIKKEKTVTKFLIIKRSVCFSTNTTRLRYSRDKRNYVIKNAWIIKNIFNGIMNN